MNHGYKDLSNNFMFLSFSEKNCSYFQASSKSKRFEDKFSAHYSIATNMNNIDTVALFYNNKYQKKENCKQINKNIPTNTSTKYSKPVN